jgi:hypothetical protein
VEIEIAKSHSHVYVFLPEEQIIMQGLTYPDCQVVMAPRNVIVAHYIFETNYL